MANIRTVQFTNSSRMIPNQLDLNFGDGSHTTILPIDHDYDLDQIGFPYIVYATLNVAVKGKEGGSITKKIDLSYPFNVDYTWSVIF